MTDSSAIGEDGEQLLGHIRFPPVSGFLLLPTSSGEAFASGLGLWSACRPLGRAFRSGARLLAGLNGQRLLKLAAGADGRLPVGTALWQETMERCSSSFGRIDEFALYSPRQEDRRGFAVLLIRDGRGVGFVKARPAYDFTQEASLLEALSEARSFQVPTPVGLWEIGEWAMLGMSAVGGAGHSPRMRTSVRDTVAEVSELLTGVLHRAEGTPEHWRAMHGDLGPWNLRHVRGGKPAVFDVEHCAYGPPGADLVFHAAACSAMRIRGAETVLEYAEAIDFWRSEIGRRFANDDSDLALATDMTQVLDEWSE